MLARHARRLRYAVGLLALAAAYYVLGRASLALQYEGPVAAVWLPSGAGAAVLYFAGRRWLPGLLIGDLALADPAQPLGSALGTTAGNMADMLVIALLLRVMLGPQAALDRLQSVGGVVVAIAAGAAISATAAALSLRAGGVIEAAATPRFWRSWFLADASGSLVIVPLALAWGSPRPSTLRARAVWEGVLVLAVVVALTVISLAGELPLAYLVFPALIWAALRFGPRGATLAVAVTAVTTVAMTAGDLGAYMEHTFTDLALSTQLYIAIAAFTALCLAAMVSERERDAAQLAESRAQAALAAAEERRRVEAELHDSAQNRLVTIALRLQLARYEVERTAPAIAATLSPLIADVDAVIGELRRIAHGTVPPLLRRQGLVAALRAECEHSAIAVHISRQGVSRSDPARELAMYLCCLEAVQNAAKHAGEDAAVRILLRDEDQRLSFTIEDTGCGFDPRTTTPGSGLANLRERIEGVGGRLEIASAPGRGTAIAGVVPWPPDPPASRDGARAAAKLS